jgi:hypothetical protein
LDQQDPPVPYALAYGTLIGALLYRGLVPWDDDIDLFCRKSDADTIRERCLASGQLEWLDIRSKNSASPVHYAKVWFKASNPQQTDHPWAWPFLDILWLEAQEEGLLLDTSNQMSYKGTDLFPTRQEPFEGRMLACPAQSEKVILQKYPQVFEVAVPQWYDHVHEHHIFQEYRDLNPPLQALIPMYPVLAETLPRLQAVQSIQ